MCIRGRVAHSPGSGSTKFYAEVSTCLLSRSLTQNCRGLAFSQQLWWTLGVGKSSGLWVRRLKACLQAAITRCQRRRWHPTTVLLPGKSQGQRNLVGCSPWGRKESDTTERLHFHFSLLCIGEGNGNPLQCSCLENPRDGGAWWAAVSGVAQSQTRLKRLSSSSITRCMTLDTLLHQRRAHFLTYNVRALIYKFSGLLYSSQHVPPRSSWKVSHSVMCRYWIVNNLTRQWGTYFNSWRKVLP